MRLLNSTALALLLGLGAIGVASPGDGEAQIMIGVSVGFAPPALPIYYQPRIPAYGYIWTPGFWAWDRGFQDYYWVPGTWVRPPRIGYLWTPGYWGWSDGVYLFNDGYWGSEVGYYGGINYGFGYNGSGYDGGEWRGGRLMYNRSVNNVSNLASAYVFSRAVAGGGGRVSFNGGSGGVQARPNAAQLAVAHATHLGATSVQQSHVSAARALPSLRSKVNHGAPAILATARPGVMRAASVSHGGQGRTAMSSSHASAYRASHAPAREAEAHRSQTGGPHRRPALAEGPRGGAFAGGGERGGRPQGGEFMGGHGGGGHEEGGHPQAPRAEGGHSEGGRPHPG